MLKVSGFLQPVEQMIAAFQKGRADTMAPQIVEVGGTKAKKSYIHPRIGPDYQRGKSLRNDVRGKGFIE